MWLWWISAHLLGVVFRLWFRIRVRGTHHVPRTGAVLIVCNHISFLDPPMVGWASRPRKSFYMAKAEIFDGARSAWMMSSFGVFPVARGGVDRNAVRIARDLLARGESVLMFPEGTRSRDGRLRAAFPGAGSMGLDTDVVIVPAAIWGSQSRTGPVRVVFGPPVSSDGLTAGTRGARAAELTRRMMEAIAELIPEAGGPPQVVNDGVPSLEKDA
ncbi:MAG: 1-acyl-sn-glycerol-3-phosphate acyltransferase [Thermoleophilia bacterium]|nr:1-acyl-sn-glycerol-3-phosphate acyltransferase [Thermoleophilia bacterium]